MAHQSPPLAELGRTRAADRLIRLRHGGCGRTGLPTAGACWPGPRGARLLDLAWPGLRPHCIDGQDDIRQPADRTSSQRPQPGTSSDRERFREPPVPPPSCPPYVRRWPTLTRPGGHPRSPRDGGGPLGDQAPGEGERDTPGEQPDWSFSAMLHATTLPSSRVQRRDIEGALCMSHSPTRVTAPCRASPRRSRWPGSSSASSSSATASACPRVSCSKPPG